MNVPYFLTRVGAFVKEKTQQAPEPKMRLSRILNGNSRQESIPDRFGDTPGFLGVPDEENFYTRLFERFDGKGH